MIAPLRRRHRWLTTLVALVVLPLAVAGLMVREAPDAHAVPAAEAGMPPTLPVLAEVSTETVMARLLADGSIHRLSLIPRAPAPAPAMLVYWTGEPGDARRLPDGALLLGAYDGVEERRYPLPPDAPIPGSVVLYSLGHQTVVDTLVLGGR